MTTEYSGQGNYRLTLKLLWGLRDQPSRGPKPKLTVEQIVQAAIRIADAEGLAALSMRRVAQELDVGTMSLYRYVPGKHELLDLMYDTVCGESPPLDGSEAPKGWRAKLELMAREDWALYHRHPWMLQMSAGRTPFGPNMLRGYEASLTIVSDIGLTEKEMVAVIDLVHSYTSGAAQVSVSASQAEQQTGISDEQWWSEQQSAIEEVIDWSLYPTAGQVSEAGVWEDYELWDNEDGKVTFGFEFGLQRILDGIEALLTQRRNG